MRVFSHALHPTPRPLLLASAAAFFAAFFATRFPDVPGASVGSYASTVLIALPSLVALFAHLGPRRAALSVLAVSAFAYAIESVGVVTGFPYGAFFYDDALGPRFFGLVPYLLPVTYVPLVIGAVAGLDLAWFEARPLFGRTIVVTRAREQASGLVVRLQRLGAATVELPTIRITDPSDGGSALAAAAATVAGVDWVVFTSVNAVDRFLALLRDARAFSTARVAAVGPGTAEALARHRVVADLVPPRAIAESLVEAFPAGPGRVLLPQAAAARPTVAAGLTAAGWQVEVVEAYRTEPAVPSAAALAEAAAADAITFTSASTVAGHVAAAGTAGLPSVVASIGPVTTAAAEAAGIPVTVEASPHTVDGLVDALVRILGRPSTR